MSAMDKGFRKAIETDGSNDAWIVGLGQPMMYDGAIFVERHDNNPPCQNAVWQYTKRYGVRLQKKKGSKGAQA